MAAVYLGSHLDKALNVWATEFATAKDPGLLDIPLAWMFAGKVVYGYLPHDCPDDQKAARITRWAGALNLAFKSPESYRDIGSLTYVGKVDTWPIEVNGVVDEAARNRAALEHERQAKERSGSVAQLA